MATPAYPQTAGDGELSHHKGETIWWVTFFIVEDNKRTPAVIVQMLGFPPPTSPSVHINHIRKLGGDTLATGHPNPAMSDEAKLWISLGESKITVQFAPHFPHKPTERERARRSLKAWWEAHLSSP